MAHTPSLSQPAFRRQVEKWIQDAPPSPDLTNEGHSRWVRHTAEAMMQSVHTHHQAVRLEDEIFRHYGKQAPVLFLLALRNAVSKLYVNEIREPVKVSVVFAMYKEYERMQKKSALHPHGENFLVEKHRQMEWLTQSNPLVSWEIIGVDDGCPEQSGQKAEDIIEKNHLNHFKILYLEEAIRQGLPVTHPMKNTSESQKGGSIAYGMWHAAQQQVPGRHIITYTDADLSTHLGQTGLLMKPLLEKDKRAAIGSRREERSVSLKKGLRNHRGKLFIYLWKKMLPQMNFITDTQCGFKSFSRETVREITEDLMEKKFAFDIELLLRTVLLDPASVEIVPIIWIDSEEASTTTSLSPYLPMLKQVARMQQKYLNPSAEARDFARFVLQLDEADFHYLLDHIPPAIRERDPKEFDKSGEVSVADLKRILAGRHHD